MFRQTVYVTGHTEAELIVTATGNSRNTNPRVQRGTSKSLYLPILAQPLILLFLTFFLYQERPSAFLREN